MFGGAPIASFGGHGSADGQFVSPREIALAPDGSVVYVVDKGAGPMNMYCEMGLAGGGWDLVANVVGQSFRVRLVIMTVPLKAPSSCD